MIQFPSDTGKLLYVFKILGAFENSLLSRKAPVELSVSHISDCQREFHCKQNDVCVCAFHSLNRTAHSDGKRIKISQAEVGGVSL